MLYADDRGVLTSAGVAAGIDLCLHMIRSDHGVDVAITVARGTVVPPLREGGQAQYIDRPVPDGDDSSTAALRVWAVEHLEEALTLQDLDRQASTSVRTLTRRFRQETGMTPMRWLGQQRLQYARRLLERTGDPVDRMPPRPVSGRELRCASTSARHWGCHRALTATPSVKHSEGTRAVTLHQLGHQVSAEAGSMGPIR